MECPEVEAQNPRIDKSLPFGHLLSFGILCPYCGQTDDYAQIVSSQVFGDLKLALRCGCGDVKVVLAEGYGW